MQEIAQNCTNARIDVKCLHAIIRQQPLQVSQNKGHYRHGKSPLHREIWKAMPLKAREIWTSWYSELQHVAPLCKQRALWLSETDGCCCLCLLCPSRSSGAVCSAHFPAPGQWRAWAWSFGGIGTFTVISVKHETFPNQDLHLEKQL